MNIIIANDFGHITGGEDKVAINSGLELSQRGYNVVFFCSTGPIADIINKSKINVINLGQNDILHNKKRIQAMCQGIWNIKAAKEFKNTIDKLDVNNTIIHIHSWTKSLSSSFVKVALDRNFKVVLTLHDYFTVCPNGGFYNYPQNKICYLKPLSKECILCNCDSRRYAHKIWRLLRQKVQNNKGLIPDSVKNYIYLSEISRKIIEPYLPREANIYYVKNPIDMEKEHPADVVHNDTYVYLGRLSKEKGCALFAEAAKELGIKVTFIGDGQQREEIKRIYPKANITGWVGKDAIKKELREARALIFPSLCYETSGLTVLEALSMGIPVIAADTCTASEVIINNKCGLLFKRNNKDDLKQKIKVLMNDNVLERYSKNAYRMYWQSDFSIKKHVNELEKVYKEIIERG